MTGNAGTRWYVERARAYPAAHGYTGPLSHAQARREQAAWSEAGWAAVLLPSTPQTRKIVREWQASTLQRSAVMTNPTAGPTAETIRRTTCARPGCGRTIGTVVRDGHPAGWFHVAPDGKTSRSCRSAAFDDPKPGDEEETREWLDWPRSNRSQAYPGRPGTYTYEEWPAGQLGVPGLPAPEGADPAEWRAALTAALAADGTGT